jgi:hypothetical protein
MHSANFLDTQALLFILVADCSALVVQIWGCLRWEPSGSAIAWWGQERLDRPVLLPLSAALFVLRSGPWIPNVERFPGAAVSSHPKCVPIEIIGMIREAEHEASFCGVFSTRAKRVTRLGARISNRIALAND